MMSLGVIYDKKMYKKKLFNKIPLFTLLQLQL